MSLPQKRGSVVKKHFWSSIVKALSEIPGTNNEEYIKMTREKSCCKNAGIFFHLQFACSSATLPPVGGELLEWPFNN